MTIGPYYFNGSTFPTQAGKPVAITESEFLDCCGCAIDLIAAYPCLDAPSGFYPYPDGMLYIGPFTVPVRLTLKSDSTCYFDDYAAGGIVDEEEWPPMITSEYFYGNLTLINPLPAGAIYRFTIISTIVTKVGLDPLECTFVKIFIHPAA